MTLFWAIVLLFLLAKSLFGGFVRAGMWIGLAFFGQVCSLSLYRAGPLVSYHHYRAPDDPVLFYAYAAGLLLQALLVGWGLWHEAGALRDWLREHLRGWRLYVVLLAMLLVAAKISRPPERSAVEFLLATAIELVSVGNLVLAVRALPDAVLARFDALLDRLLGAERVAGEPDPGGLDRFAWGAAALALGAAALLNVFAYERHPHVPDEVVYLLHARTFAEGLLTLPAPPVPAAFDLDLMLLDGERWFSPVPPGWPAVLALGALVGAAWLVNPVLGALTVLAGYALTRELTDRRSARWAAALLVASPWFTFMNMSFMTHSWMLLCAVFAALGVARSRRTGSLAWTLAAGAAIGVVSLIRPLEGLTLALALGLWSIGLGGARLRLPAIAALVLGTVAVGSLNFAYNRELTGDPKQFPINEYVDRTYGPGKNALGFGPDKGLEWGGLDPFPGHSPLDGVLNTQFNLFAIDSELFGWSTGSLLLVFFLLAGGRLYRKDRAMLVYVAAVVGPHFCYWFAGGPDFGARYWYPVIFPLVLLTVSGLRALEARLERPVLARAFLYLAVSIAWLTWVPWRAVDKYRDYRGMAPDVRALASEHDFGRSLVLVQGERHPDYASAAVYNPLDLEADAPIYAWDANPTARREVLEHYRDRPVWTIRGTRDGGRFAGYEVVSGPVSAEELLP
jgi:4-amino-4-deoxy-L-arabinose transferase-like glycosyltransferase